MTARETWLTKYAFKRYAPASDDPRLYGWEYYPVEDAVSKKYVRTNPARLTSMLVFDVDDPEAESTILSKAWDTEEIPEPNWITINPLSKHAHVGYWLQDPVATSDVSSYAARKFLYDTQKRLTVALGGDKYYSHGVTRSPFTLTQSTRFMREDSYLLKDLAKTLKEIKLLETYEVDTNQGRNVNLFESVRVRAYSARRSFTNYNDFHAYVLGVTAETNLRMNFGDLLPTSEERSIAKSIANWTWNNLKPAKFSKDQAYRVNQRWEKVRNGDITNERRLLRLAEVREEVDFLKSRGLSHAEIARATGLTKAQVKSRLQYSRRLNDG